MRDAKRYLSQSTRLAGAAEAVLKKAAADPSSLTQELILKNLDKEERGRLSRIRNIGIAVRPMQW
jgi:elongation factor G